MKKQRHISIRIDEMMLKKFHYVAKYEDRSLSRQISFLIHKCIREFEEKNGEIEKADRERIVVLLNKRMKELDKRYARTQATPKDNE